MSDNAVSGGLSNMSMWVTFKDIYDVTHVVLRSRCSRNLFHERAVLLDAGTKDETSIPTHLTYNEIFKG